MYIHKHTDKIVAFKIVLCVSFAELFGIFQVVQRVSMAMIVLRCAAVKMEQTVII